ncbi:MAG TPA: magnesium/cobalt transporter CorA [Flavilitoribacter sp.]|nr:magnesium/cobalt transporter CorA [Flavilitoribacter sp.]
MLHCFYRENTRLRQTDDPEEYAGLDPGRVVWIDLYNSSNEEKSFVENRFKVELFTRQEAEEIESSSKFSENDQEINANLNYIYKRENGVALDPVSFILREKLLITQRNIPLRSFDEAQRAILQNRRPQVNGYHIFLILFETRVDIEADFLEDLSRKIYAVGRGLALEKEVPDSILIDIFNFQELTILFRESTSELKRLFSSILRSEYFPKDEYEKLRVMIKDADSLVSHTSFLFERLEYLQNTFLGLIDMKQNKIIKIFTVMTVVFMPPTLIASLYGMNFHFMPELNWQFGYPLALGLMALSSLITLFFFRWKKWL